MMGSLNITRGVTWLYLHFRKITLVAMQGGEIIEDRRFVEENHNPEKIQ